MSARYSIRTPVEAMASRSKADGPRTPTLTIPSSVSSVGKGISFVRLLMRGGTGDCQGRAIAGRGPWEEVTFISRHKGE